MKELIIPEVNENIHQLSTGVVKLDWNFILDNFYKPALWDKTWTIFKYGDFEVTFRLDNIYMRGRLYYYVHLYYKGSNVSSDFNGLSFKKEHRNITVIDKGLTGVVFSLFKKYESDLIEKSPEYSSALSIQRQIKERAREAAAAFLDSEGIEHEGIREAYIEAQEDQHSTTHYTRTVREEMANRFILDLRTTFAYYADSDTHIRKYSTLARDMGYDLKSLEREMEELQASMDDGSFVDTLELESIF